jgi:hypothetical protein
MNSLNNNAFSGPTSERFEATKATQSEAVAGSDNKKYMTPLRTFQAVAAWIAQNLSTFPPAAHGHPTSEVTGLDSALAGKAAASHTHTASQITDFAAAVSAAAPPTTNASLLTSGTLPDARLSAGVATSLGKADSALQSSALTPYRTASAQDTIDAGKATAAQGTKADTALQAGAAISNISGLQTALDGKQPAGSYATLVGGLVPSSQLPSYVDDVLEYATLASFPANGETGKIYVATGTGKIYRWSGSAYVEIVAAPGSTDAVTEGSTNLYFTAARAVSALASTLASYATTTALNSAISGLASVYTTTAAVASQITAYGYQTAAQVSSAISSALASYATTASVNTALAAKLNLSESSYIIAKPGDDLAEKYTAAKALTPNGAAKSDTNRASLIIFPGRYTLSAELAIDTEFVDLIGLGAQRQKPAVFVSGNTLNVSANNVFVGGISVISQQFKISGNKPLQSFENCVGGNGSFGGWGFASGRFVGCIAGHSSFGAWGGVQVNSASGTFIDCVGGDWAFGGYGKATGSFTNCLGGFASFGGDFGCTASGTFSNCVGGQASFGGFGLIPNTAVFMNCNGGRNSFGSYGVVDGTFFNCVAGDVSFGGSEGDYTGNIAGGVFVECTAGVKSFGAYGTVRGSFTNCKTTGTFNSLTAPTSGRALMLNCVDGNGNIINGQAPL